MKTRTRWAVIAAAGVLCAILLALPRSGADVERLEADSPVVREMAGNQLHSYELFLESDQFLSLVVTQEGIDVAITVLAPDGRELILVDSPNGDRGPEPVILVATETGMHQLELRSPESSSPGSYEIRIEELRRATDRDRWRARAARLLHHGQQLAWKGRDSLADAVVTYQEALEWWRKARDARWEAETLDRLGYAHEQMGREDEAIEIYRLAASTFRTLGLGDEEAAIVNRISRVLRDSGRFQEAQAGYQRSLNAYRESGNRYGQAMVLNNMALLFKLAGETQKALDLYGRALALWREDRAIAEEAATLTNMGGLYVAQGQYELALDPLQRALELRRDAGDRNGEAITLGSLGTAYIGLGEPDVALDVHRRALELRRSEGGKAGEAVAHNDLGNAFYELGELGESLASYERSLELFRELGDRRRAAIVEINVGWIHLDQRAPDPALECFERALPEFRRLNDRGSLAPTLFGIARAMALRNAWPEARRHAQEALEIVEFLRTGSLSEAQRSSYLATKHHYYSFLIDVLMRLHHLQSEGGFDAQAFEVSERSSARGLLETLIEANADIRQGVDAALLDKERSLRARLNFEEQERLRLADSTDDERLAVLESDIRKTLLDYRELQAQIRASSPRYAALTQPRPLGLRQIQEEVLDDDTLLLEYSLGEERSYLWLVDSAGIETFELPGASQIEAKAQQAHRLLRYSAQPDVTVQARLVNAELSEILLGRVMDRIEKKRLLVVAPGALQYVPFGALPVPDGNGVRQVPLLVDHEIVSLPSASVLAVQRRELAQRRPAPKTIAVLADPVVQPDDPRIVRSQDDDGTEFVTTSPKYDAYNLRRLPHTRGEAQAIVRDVAEEQRLVELDFDADRQLVTSGGLSDYRIVHFATHGLLHARHPELSGIVLSLFDPQGRSRHGFLWAHEIYNLDLNADLVVLSACETALGREVRGEGLLGLTRGFMYAGAARVVVSLWRVSDRSTAELMTRFYRAMLHQGLSPAAALREAQLSMARDPRWSAPYHWAGFVLQGEWK